MINPTEKELIVAYFQGGNAKDKHTDSMKLDLEAIKEAAAESRGGAQMVTVTHPSRPNPAR